MNQDELNVLVKEVYNEEHISFKNMTLAAQSVLSVEWKSVEWFSTDQKEWVPNPVCPRQWNEEAYRVPASVFPYRPSHPKATS